MRAGKEGCTEAAPLGRRIAFRPALGRESIELIKEEDAWVCGACARKQLPHCPLALPDILIQQLRPLYRDEIRARFRCDRLGNKRFAAAGRTEKEDA